MYPEVPASEIAQAAAAQAWTTPETSGIEMDVRLANAVALTIDGWVFTALQAERNTAYYRGLLDQIAESLGPSAYTADDGVRHPDPIRAKLPELVRQSCYDLALPQIPGPRPTIVCLCGSTRFADAYREANMRETLAGKIVIAPGVFAHQGDPITEEQKKALDELHLRKIDMADEVLVLNVGGYIGKSTACEIAYAQLVNKPVRYLESAGNAAETPPPPKPATRAEQWGSVPVPPKPPQPASEPVCECGHQRGDHASQAGGCWVCRCGSYRPAKPAPAAPAPAEGKELTDEANSLQSELCECGHEKGAHQLLEGCVSRLASGMYCDCNRYRPAKPAPSPTAPTCPVCGAVGMFPPGSTGEWYCDQCHKPWDESRRKPCRECAELRAKVSSAEAGLSAVVAERDRAQLRVLELQSLRLVAYEATERAKLVEARCKELEAAASKPCQECAELRQELTKKAVAERCLQDEIDRQVAEVAARTEEAEQYRDERDSAERRVQDLERQCADWKASYQALRQARADAEKRADALQGRIDRALQSLPHDCAMAQGLRGEV